MARGVQNPHEIRVEPLQGVAIATPNPDLLVIPNVLRLQRQVELLAMVQAAADLQRREPPSRRRLDNGHWERRLVRGVWGKSNWRKI